MEALADTTAGLVWGTGESEGIDKSSKVKCSYHLVAHASNYVFCPHHSRVHLNDLNERHDRSTVHFTRI